MTTMTTSTKYSFLALRVGLAAVFFWFGVDKFLDPTHWINAWVPENVISILSNLGVSATQFIYINGIFEVLVALSLLTTVFLRFFSLLAVLFLLVVISVFGLSEVLVRDIGLIGGFVAILLWPERMNGFHG